MTVPMVRTTTADGLFDCEDPDCAEDAACVDDFEGDEAGECTDGVDNDSDGLIDCEDPDCEGSPDCESTNDADGDGFEDINAGGDDCDDNNPNVYPMAGDTYGDGVDSDCDGLDCEAASDGITYYTICPWTSGTINEIRQTCSDMGYDGLTTITSELENSFVATMADSKSVWIGGSDQAQEGIWVWDSGLPFLYTAWSNNSGGQPDNTNGNENCLAIHGINHSWSSTWNDVSCSTTGLTDFSCELRSE